MFFIIISALHVSGGFSAYHQELIKCMCSLGYYHAFLLSTAGILTPAVDSRKTCQYPRLHIHFYKLLMMGEKNRQKHVDR